MDIESGIKGLKLRLLGDGKAQLWFDENVSSSCGTWAYFDLHNLQTRNARNEKECKEAKTTIKKWISLQEIRYLPKNEKALNETS